MFFLKSMCFLCLRDDQKYLTSVLNLDVDNVSIQSKLEFCIPELINLHIEVPKLVCGLCLQYINFLYIFKQKCIENTIRLKQYTEQLKSWKSVSDDKYHNLLVSVSDIKDVGLKSKVPDSIFKKKIEYDDLAIKITSEPYAPRPENILLNIKKEYIKEEFIDLDNFNLYVEENEFSNVENQNNTTYSHHETNAGLFILETSENTDVIKFPLNLEDSNVSKNNGIKQTARESNNILFEDIANNSYDDEIPSEQKIQNFDIYKMKKDKLTGKFHCFFCSKVYSKGTDLDIHLRKFHLEDKPFHCQFCPEKFQFRSKFKSHLIQSHNNIYACTFCDKKYNRNCELIKHLKLHSEKRFQCHICLKKFHRTSHYTNHLNTHTGKKPFDCADCGKKFTTKNNLASHSRVHSGARPYKCSVCGRDFSDWTHCRSHMDNHTGYKRYRCTICPSRFTFKSNLRCHMMSKHSNERPFKCTVCGKHYKRKTHLKEHSKIHSNHQERNLEKVKCD